MKTITVNRQAVERLAKRRPGALWITEALQTGGQTLTLDRARWLEWSGSQTIHAKHVSRQESIPRHQWPLWARGVELLRKPGDQGVGDTIHWYATRVGGEKFKVMMTALGVPCGCDERREHYNQRFPYHENPTEKTAAPPPPEEASV